MKRRSSKVMAIALAVIMVLSMMPISAIAATAPAIELNPMENFLKDARELELGYATANKVIEPVSSDTFDISLYLAGKNGVPKANPIDLVFVIDTSGSMTNADITSAQNAFRNAANQLFAGTEAATGLPANVKRDSRIALVTYDQTAKIANFTSGSTTVQWVTQSVWGTNNRNNLNIINNSVWTRNNYTATQLGIHAGHYLMNNRPTGDAYAANQKIMIVMTDGGPNRVYTGSSNTVSVTGVSSYGSVSAMNPTKAPNTFSNFGTGDNSSANANGNASSISKTLAQAQYAREDGITVYAIGYNVAGVENQSGSVAYKSLYSLAGSAGTNFQHGGQADIGGILTKLTVSAAVRLQQLSITDMIGSGFEIVGTPKPSDIRKAELGIGKTFANLEWKPLLSSIPDDIDDNIQLPGSKVIWNAGTVTDGVLYRLTFRVKLTDTAASAISGTYYTNMNNSGGASNNEHTYSESNNKIDKNSVNSVRGMQDGTQNKLTYMFDGKSNEDKNFHNTSTVKGAAKPVYLYACEKIVVKNTYNLTVGKAGTAKNANDTFKFTVKLTSNVKTTYEKLQKLVLPTKDDTGEDNISVTSKNFTKDGWQGVTLTFSLKIGQSVTFKDLPKDIRYYAEETVGENYITPLWSINGIDLEGTSVSTVNEKRTLTADTTVMCNNTAKVSDFTIAKSIEYGSVNSAGWVAGEKIIFKVTVARAASSNVDVVISSVEDIMDIMATGTLSGPYSDANASSESAWGKNFTLSKSTPSKTRYYSYIVGDNDAGNYTNTAKATSNGITKSDTEDFTVVRPTLTIVKEVLGTCDIEGCTSCAAGGDGYHDIQAIVSNGTIAGTASFRVTVTNTSRVPATGITVTDDIADWVQISTDETDPTQVPFSLNAGQSRVMYFDMKVESNIIALPDFDYTTAQLDAIDAAKTAKSEHAAAIGAYETAVNAHNDAISAWKADASLTDALAAADLAVSDYITANGDLATLRTAFEDAETAYITKALEVNAMDIMSGDYVAAFDEAVGLETAMNDALALYNGLVDLMKVAADAQNAIADAQANDTAIGALKDTVDAASIAMNAAEAAAQTAADSVGELGIPENLLTKIEAQLELVQNVEHTNTAKVYADAAVIIENNTDTATAIIPPVKQSALRSDKVVSVDGGTSFGWQKVLDPENLPSEVIYKLSVSNLGLTTIVVSLEDIFGNSEYDLTNIDDVAEDSTITLNPGKSWIGTYSVAISNYLNDSTANSKHTANTFTATLISADGVEVNSPDPLTSSTIVITPPKKYTDVTIGKWVMDGDNGWQKESVVYSNDAQTFLFKIELANYGTEDAIVSLTDVLVNNEFYTDEGLTKKFEGNSIKLTANGGTETLYASYNAASGEHTTNVAAYELEEGGLKDEHSPASGESKADVHVIPELIPTPVFSVEKVVDANGNGHIKNMLVNQGNAIIQSDETEFDIWFAVKVANTGTGAGNVILRDIFNGRTTDETAVYDAPYALDALGDETPIDLADAIELDACEERTFYILVHIEGHGTYENVAKIFDTEDKDFEDPIDEDEAEVIITNLDVVQINIDKKVRIKGAADDTWHDSISELVPNGTNTIVVEYKITVSVERNDKIQSFNISGNVCDMLDDEENLNVGEWIYNLHWGMDDDAQLSDELIYEVTLNSSIATKYTNVASLVKPDGQPDGVQETLKVTYGPDADAEVTITKPTPTEYNPPVIIVNPPVVVVTPPEEPEEMVLGDDPIPLAPAPIEVEPEEEIPEPEVPLAEAPHTGDTFSAHLALVIAIFSLLGIAVIFITRKKNLI